MREYEFDDSDSFSRMRGRRRAENSPQPGRRGRLTERERSRLTDRREEMLEGRPPHGDRWTTWGQSEHGPKPRPGWVVTNLAAADTELGTLKTGKEANVHLIRREVDETSCLMAAKRYRSDDHKTFHRDSQYLEGRRMRRSRENRAMTNRSSFGRNLIAEQWAAAEFGALSRLWSAGVPVPYPVQRDGTELLLEFLGSEDGEAAPRLAELKPTPAELHNLWDHLLAALVALAGQGYAHGDLSAYNILVYNGEPVLIDLPQVVDVVANPTGPEFLARDVKNILTWFTNRGLAPEIADQEDITDLLITEAGLH